MNFSLSLWTKRKLLYVVTLACKDNVSKGHLGTPTMFFVNPLDSLKRNRFLKKYLSNCALYSSWSLNFNNRKYCKHSFNPVTAGHDILNRRRKSNALLDSFSFSSFSFSSMGIYYTPMIVFHICILNYLWWQVANVSATWAKKYKPKRKSDVGSVSFCVIIQQSLILTVTDTESHWYAAWTVSARNKSAADLILPTILCIFPTTIAGAVGLGSTHTQNNNC